MVSGRAVFLVAVLQILSVVDGRVVRVSVDGAFTFLDKFCFDTEGGEFTYTTDGESGKYSLVLYNDHKWSWPAAHAIISDGDIDDVETCNALTRPCKSQCRTCMLACGWPKAITYSEGKSSFSTMMRPRIWYFGAANCDAKPDDTTKSVIVMHFTNPGTWWRREFGVDEQGILELQCIIVPLFSFIAGSYVAMAFVDVRRQGDGARIHAVVWWYIVIIVLQCIYYVEKLVAYAKIATYGEGVQYLSGCRYFSSVFFLMLVLNFSTGFSAVGVDFMQTLKDPFHQSVILYTGLGLIVLNFLMYLHSYLTFDPMSTDHDYQGWPAIILSCLRLPIAVYFLWNLMNSIAEVPRQKLYYLRWGALFLLYILSPPLFIMAAHLFSPHVKFRAVDCTIDVVSAVSMVAGCVLLWPGPGLTVTLSNTYQLAVSGPTHMPMDHVVHQSRAIEMTETISQPPPAHPDDVDPFAGTGGDDMDGAAASLLQGDTWRSDREAELAS